MALKHLTFFDKLGNKLTPKIENDIYNINIFFEETSKGLFDVQHLFILEEVLRENSSYESAINKYDTPAELLDIKIMRFLYDANDVVFRHTLESQFPTLSLEKDYINEFASANSIYVEKNYEYAKEYFYLTEAGRNYIEEYNNKLNELEYASYNIDIDYVRPRTSYIQKTEDTAEEYFDETFLFFKWKESINDKNIFIYLIDYNPNNLYVDKDNSVCFKDDEKYPIIVPIYNQYLNPIDENPNWKLWFTPYKFDDGRNDSYELNNTPDWNQNGYDESEAYPKIYDKFGKRVFHGRRILSNDAVFSKRPLQFNFALHAETEGTFQRTLEIYAIKTSRVSNSEGEYVNHKTTYKIANVNFYGEVVDEDERLEILLNNFGRSVAESEITIFRDSEIDDDRPDYIKLNEKRKELLLASDVIFPYIGSYKAFTNILKYFGYGDIRLKEYFINTVLSTPVDGEIYYSAVEVPLTYDESNKKLYNEYTFGNLLDSEVYYKSSRFGFFYDINTFSGLYDNDGFPIMKDSYQYTNEEILLKLYGLKTVLEDKYLPHNVRIINITGEGIYFGKIKVRSWTDRLNILSITKTTNPSFSAIPEKGYIKSLNALLNIYKRKNNILDKFEYFDTVEQKMTTINEYTKISDIIDYTISDFIKDSSTDIKFDTELPIEKIEKFYDTYEAVSFEIFNKLNSTCSNKFNPSITSNEIHKKQLYGQPVLISLNNRIVRWQDMTLQYEYHENDILDTSDIFSLSWDDTQKYQCSSVEWQINHTSTDYCYTKYGSIDDNNELLIFLPHVGFYDVTCIIKDNGNYPHITRYEKCIEVLDKDIDFVAIGRSVHTVDTDIDRLTWDTADTIWSSQIQTDIKTIWDKSLLSWDALYYSYYQNQDFIDYMSEYIFAINYEDISVTLQTSKFYEYWNKYKEQYFGLQIVLEKSTVDKIDVQYNRPVLDVTYDNKIHIAGNHKLRSGDKINIHKYINTTKFVLHNNILTLESKYYEDIIAGKNINLYTIDGYKKYTYEIEHITVDYTIDRTYVVLQNDSSLNELIFSTLEFNSYETILYVTNVEYSRNNQSTIITVSDTSKYLTQIKKNIVSEKTNISDWKIDTHFLHGYFPFIVDRCILDENGNTKIYFNENIDWCNIDVNFTVKYSTYNIHNALTHATSNKYVYDNLLVTYDNLSNQTYDTLNYHQLPIYGFKITQIRDTGYISINGTKFEYDVRNCNFGDRLYKLVELLNASKLPYFSSFEYTVIENTYIQATAKQSNSTNYYNILSSLGTICSKSTYPVLWHNKWETEFYDGDNKPALWNTIKRHSYYKSEQNVYSTFNWSDTFIATENISIPICTTLFIIFDKFKVQDNLTYEWELWYENESKLLAQSTTNYIIWNFTISGNYTVKLRTCDEYGNKKEKTKKAWIYVKK